MPVYFVDSSALAKRYVHEAGSEALRSLLDAGADCRIVIARITSVELASAIARRHRAGDLTAADAADARNALASDMVGEYRVVELTAAIAADAMALAERHMLRAYDAVQLATAVNLDRIVRGAGLEPTTVVSSDVELNAAAAREGLAVVDPNLTG